MEEKEKLERKCQELKKELIENADILSESNMKFVEEGQVRIRLYQTFFDKLCKLSDNFHNKCKFITDRYVEIVKENKAKIESEILVQDKFLEFNNSIDSIVNSIKDSKERF